MIICKLGSLILMLCSCIPLIAQSSNAADHLREFRDPSTGVKYRYPEGWRQLSGNQLDLHLAFVPDQTKIRSGVLWTPSGTLKSTNLTGAEFVFALQRRISARDCMHPVAAYVSGPHVDSVTLNDIQFAHNWAGAGGLCHYTKEDIYATYQNHACYLFDFSVDSICSGAVDGMREATKEELADVNAQLMSILANVRIDKRARIATH